MMPLLDAALAFTVTMLAVATVVTGLVKFLDWLMLNEETGKPRVLPLVEGWLKAWLEDRVQLFNEMVEEFQKQELKNIIKRMIRASEPIPADETAAKAADEAAEAAAEDRAAEAIKKICDDLIYGRTQVLTHLSNSDLIDKLKQTDLGRQIMNLADNKGAAVFEEISKRYASIERKYSEIYRQNARYVSTVVALIMAIVFNIDTVNIAHSYLKDPALSASIAAKTDSMLANYDATIAKLTPDGKATAPADVKNAVDKSKEVLTQQLNELNAGGFPFGWSYFPYGGGAKTEAKPDSPDAKSGSPDNKAGSPDPKTGSSDAKSSSPDAKSDSPKRKTCPVAAYGAWVVGILLTGFLAGLGAPFWHDVVRNLNAVTRGTTASKPEEKKQQ